MALKNNLTCAVNISNTPIIARVITTRWMVIDGERQEWAFVTAPEIGEGWVSPVQFIGWVA